jgi:hypothetical protein
VFGGFSLDCEELVRQQGAGARARCRGHAARVDTIRRRIARHAIACDAVEGGVLLANWFDDDAILRRRQALMAREFGVHWQYLTRRSSAHGRAPSATAAGCSSPMRSTSIR